MALQYLLQFWCSKLHLAITSCIKHMPRFDTCMYAVKLVANTAWIRQTDNNVVSWTERRGRRFGLGQDDICSTISTIKSLEHFKGSQRESVVRRSCGTHLSVIRIEEEEDWIDVCFSMRPRMDHIPLHHYHPRSWEAAVSFILDVAAHLGDEVNRCWIWIFRHGGVNFIKYIPCKPQVYIIPKWGHDEQVTNVISAAWKRDSNWRIDRLIKWQDPIGPNLNGNYA